FVIGRSRVRVPLPALPQRRQASTKPYEYAFPAWLGGSDPGHSLQAFSAGCDHGVTIRRPLRLGPSPTSLNDGALAEIRRTGATGGDGSQERETHPSRTPS